MDIIGWIVVIFAILYLLGAFGRSNGGCLTSIIVGLVVLWLLDTFSLGQLIVAAIVGWIVKSIFL